MMKASAGVARPYHHLKITGAMSIMRLLIVQASGGQTAPGFAHESDLAIGSIQTPLSILVFCMDNH